jgi:hypothetical protein
MELGCASGDVQGRNVRVALQEFDDAFDPTSIESLPSFWAGFDVAVMAGQVAAQSDIELKRRDLLVSKRFEASCGDVLVELIGLENRVLRSCRSSRPLIALYRIRH